MNIAPLEQSHTDAVMDLFCAAFRADGYYAALFPDPETREQEMRSAFASSIAFCLSCGESRGIFGEDGRLCAFLLCFDYRAVKRTSCAQFRAIFGAAQDSALPLPYAEAIHERIEGIEGDVRYLLSIASAEDCRGRGLASALVEDVLEAYPDCSLVGDVSNAASLGIYHARNFTVTEIGPDYYLVIHARGTSCSAWEAGRKVRLLVPDTEQLSALGLDFKVLRPERCLANAAAVRFRDQCYFTRAPGALCTACEVSLRYDALLRYQRAVNLSQYDECFSGEAVYYRNIRPYSESPLVNGVLAEMLLTREREWGVIPDLFVSVPMLYRDPDKLAGLPAEGAAPGILLHSLDFRTRYEAGIPNANSEVDDLASFKLRIRRSYLGKVQVRISGEPDIRSDRDCGDPIGASVYVDLYVSVDTESDCAVLTWYSLSAPFLISQLMDNVIRNQLEVVRDGRARNFFDDICERFGLVKRGTPKMFVVIPQDRDCLSRSQTASLLAGETIYPDGENFGSIVDSDILAAVNSPTGMGQYDRATVLAHTNVVLQFSPSFCGSVQDRLEEGSITLFYIELILLEEAAIQIADREIIRLFSANAITDPVDFLTQVDRIYDDYSKTTEFWDIQVNYPTSQKSIDMLRGAFRIRQQLEFMKRNMAQLQTVFGIKSNIIDRRESNRMDVSLAILSVLAVFSAWIDGHDYIATWSNVFSDGTIHLLQRALFALILITAVFAVGHLFGHRLFRPKQDKTKRERKPWK